MSKIEELRDWGLSLYFLAHNNSFTFNWNGTKFKLFVSTYCEYNRGKEGAKREPKTNKWIDGFKKNDVFYDIGANVGIYSLYAAKRVGCQVFAFEPLYHNFSTLNKNIILNDLGDMITAYCLCLHESLDIDKIHMKSLESGYGTAYFKHGEADIVFKQGSIGLPIDEVTKFLPFPNHIKIDVDGNERYIVEGMKKTLQNAKLRSVLIEIREDKEWFMNIFTKAGFELVDTELAGKHKGKDFYDYIFVRKS